MPHKNCRSEAGSVIAETAVSVGIFLLLLLTTVDAVFYMYSIAATQYSINEAARKLILLPSTNSAIKSEIVSTAAKYGIILQSSNITICDNDHHGFSVSGPPKLQPKRFSKTQMPAREFVLRNSIERRNCRIWNAFATYGEDLSVFPMKSKKVAR